MGSTRLPQLTRLFCLLVVGSASPAMAWNAHGHRTITLLALDGLKPETPSWLRDPAITARVAEQSTEPDHWRSTRRPSINHDANTEHYIDVEDLEQFDLSLPNIPRLRYEYVKAMVTAKIEHPEKILPYNADKDPDHTKEWPGFLPQALDEHYDKLRSSFHTLRILEAVNDSARVAARAQARENVVYEMGVLSHLVGDATQPLHTTRHHHGWIGPNPQGYTTDNGFHAYIDATILSIHGFNHDTLKNRVKFEREINASDPWRDLIELIDRSYQQVEPLYVLQRDHTLEKEQGKDFIAERLCDAASMLAGLYNGAWEISKPTDSEIANFVKFDPAAAPAAPVLLETR